MKFPNQFRQKFPNQLHNMYEAYNRAMHPFPLDVHEVYRACWTTMPTTRWVRFME